MFHMVHRGGSARRQLVRILRYHSLYMHMSLRLWKAHDFLKRRKEPRGSFITTDHSGNWNLIHTGFTCKHTFLLTSTRIKLSIMEHGFPTEDAEISVSVTGYMQQGAYCYYYNEIPELAATGSLLENISNVSQNLFLTPLRARAFNSLKWAGFKNLKNSVNNFQRPDMINYSKYLSKQTYIVCLKKYESSLSKGIDIP